MVTLFENDRKEDGRKSSKGNQLKWLNNEMWYKADYTGYEGLAEYITSHLLQKSNLPQDAYILYETEEIQYGTVKYLGCKSGNFLKEGWQIITLERLFKNYFGESLYESIYKIRAVEDRVSFLVEQTERITGLKEFGKYLSWLLTIDAFFLNEDRHMHNIAVLRDVEGAYHYCPIFDNGGALLSDTTMDYPLVGDVYEMIDRVKSKTVSSNFEEQLEAVEKLYGQHLKFEFGRNDIAELLDAENYYSEPLKTRVQTILLEQKRRYNYLMA